MPAAPHAGSSHSRAVARSVVLGHRVNGCGEVAAGEPLLQDGAAVPVGAFQQLGAVDRDGGPSLLGR
ncbi:hypothetical protein OQI_26045 [Streptomyces pharetrae CZA14]|uniref:Uncharacterized protein n=1 Tax=Streptomyces pharetrae CZA14 TaxID=1144883 RepID=A0ABX3YCP3_9ACTN|nr:hypothetical protein OQI_26045 [Streptomyces pharetrae CZA14]